jgi:hypothetical protein
MNNTFNPGRVCRAASAIWRPFIPFGSPDVCYQQIDPGSRLKNAHTGRTIRSLDDCIAMFFEYFRNKHPNSRLVINHQHDFPLARGTIPYSQGESVVFLCGLIVPGQVKTHGGPLAQFRVNANLSSGLASKAVDIDKPSPVPWPNGFVV